MQKAKQNLLRCMVLLLIATLFVGAPHGVSAVDLEVSGWIPYWAVSKGTQDAKKHIDELTVLHPFGYSIKQEGMLHDLMGLKKRPWQTLFRSARSKGVLVIPTVTSGDGALIHTILSNPELRKKHVQFIVATVTKGKFDGIDIDYEGKRSETKEYFSTFLKELKTALGSKLLTCAIEARTPPDSLYKIMPATIAYANDYGAIGMYCDRVELMTYDQRRADIKLNESKAGDPYMPTADVDWVRKVAELAVKLIPKEKLILGIATYGHNYEVTVSPNWYQDYKRVGAINPSEAIKLAKKKKVIPSRNRAGELGFSYSSIFSVPEKELHSLSIPEDTATGNIIAARALAYANTTGNTTRVNIVSWSDALAVRAKVDLARELGLRGVALFKIDGGEDHKIWDLFDER